MSNRRLGAVVLAIGFCLPFTVGAKTYCCTDKNGSRYCGDSVPEQCGNRAYREIGRGGIVRNVAAPLTPEQKAQREAEEARKKEEDRLAADQRRKDQALLETYGSEKDIDGVRDRSLADLETASTQARVKHTAALQRKQQLDRELEFYVKKPVPAALKAQIKETDTEIEAQKKALDDKAREIDAIRAKFEEDRRRYRELTGSGKPVAGVDTRPR